MSRRPSAIQRLEATYRRIPQVACKGLCQESCGALGMSRLERRRLVQACGNGPKADPATLTCNLLTADGRCSQYALRPAICRLWGALRSMACPHGCRPSRWLEEHESRAILAEVAELGGGEVIDETLMERVRALGRARADPAGK